MKDIRMAIEIAEAARDQGTIKGWSLSAIGDRFTASAMLPFRGHGPLNSFVQRADAAEALVDAVMEALHLSDVEARRGAERIA